MRSIYIKLPRIIICFIGDRWTKSKLTALFLIATGFSLCAPASLAIEVEENNATNTQIESEQLVTTELVTTEEINITGGETVGTNLFHQFEKFGLSENATANFLSDSEIQNIIGHITGGELSVIDGTINIIDGSTLGRSDANLYLINPAGILFGPSIRLNILGDFTATTATAIEFNEAILDLSQNTTADYSQLSGDPSGFIFNGSGPIANLGTLRVESEKIISLLGSTLLNLGNIEAPGGGIRLSAIEDNTIVRINQDNRLLALEIPVNGIVSQTGGTPSKTVAELLTGGNSDIDKHLQIDQDGVVRLVRSPGIDLIIPDHSNSVINSGNLSVASESLDGGTVDIFGNQIGILDGQINASGRNGGTLRVGSEYAEFWGTTHIYTDSQAVLTARAESGDTYGSTAEARNGGQIIFREDNSNVDGGYRSHGRYVNQLYSDLDVRSLAPLGSGGNIRLRGAGRATTYLADTHLEGNGGQDGNITFEAIDVEISDIKASGYINGVDSLFANPSDVNIVNKSNSFRLPQSTIENFNNVQITALDGIALENLAHNKLTFQENSIVRFLSDADNAGGGQFDMKDSGQTLVAPNGNVTIRSGRMGDLRVRNITTRPTNGVDSSPDEGIRRDRVQLISNDINLIGGTKNDGHQSLNTRALTVNSARPESGMARNGIYIGGLTEDPSQQNSLNLSNNIIDVLKDSASRLRIGNRSTGDIIFSDTMLGLFRNSLRLRSQSSINIQTPLITSNRDANLSFIADGDIETENIIAHGSVDFSSIGGRIATGAIQLRSLPSDNSGDVTLAAKNSVFVDSDSSSGQSISTADGQITIQYGTDSAFSVGTSTANGTAGTITSAEDSLSNIEILDSYDAGKKLKIIGPNRGSTPIEETTSSTETSRISETIDPSETASLPPLTPTQLSEQAVQSTAKLEDTDSQFLIPVEPRSESAIATALFNQLEEKTGARFQAYLSLSGANSVATIHDVQKTLKRVAKTTQQKPGLVYIYYTPNAAREEAVRPSISSQNRDDDELEILLITADGTPIRKRQWGVTRSQVEAVAAEFRRQATSQFSTPRDYLPPAQQLHQWLISPIEQDIKQQNIANLAFIMDDGLRTIPIAALHNGQRFLIEDYSLGLMPTFSLTEIELADRAQGVDDLRVLAMGASKFKEQAPLPAVESELAFISRDLSLSNAFLNDSFTLDNLKSQITSQQYDVLHLATHAVFESGDAGQSYIQLWNDRLDLSDIDTLGLSQSDIDLIILSACSTALGDRNSEYGFAGLAVNAGAQSALASIWPVSDEGTLGFMTQFYQDLPTARLRADALRTAQINMLQGKVGIDQGRIYGPTYGSEQESELAIPELAQSGTWDFSHPFYWSAFTLIGSPW